MKNKSFRRDFIKMGSASLGSLAITPFINPAAGLKESAEKNPAKKMNIVCLGAHPGDPEFGCGGTLAKFSSSGHSVTCIYVTRGEAGDPSKSFAESAALRTREAETACKLMQCKAIFAEQIDGNTILSKEKSAEMSRLILSEKPDILLTQWPIDSHPDHQVTGMLGLTTWVQSGRSFTLYFYEVNTGSETMGFVPTDYVDISDLRELKKEAMFAHKTQDPVETYNNYFKPLEEFRGLEAGVKAAEGFVLFKDKSERATMAGL
jgi:LmbE family N-acetylglucosaminyl deacetylase